MRSVVAPSGGRHRKLLRLPVFHGVQPQAHHHLLEQIARPPGVAGGAAADANRVAALRLEIEQRVKGDNAKNSRQRHSCLLSDVFKRIARKKIARIVFLDLLQDAQQCAGAAIPTRNYFINKVLIDIQRRLRRNVLHWSISPASSRSCGVRPVALWGAAPRTIVCRSPPTRRRPLSRGGARSRTTPSGVGDPRGKTEAGGHNRVRGGHARILPDDSVRQP